MLSTIAVYRFSAFSQNRIEMVKMILSAAKECFDESQHQSGKLSFLNLFTDCEGNTPLHDSKSREMTLLLLKFGFSMTAANVFGALPIHSAAMNGNRSVVHTLINNETINALTAKGETPLFVAAASGQKDIVQLLLKCGADAAIPDNDWRTPLHVAASRNYYEIVKVC